MDNTAPRDANETTYQDPKSTTTPNPYLHDLGESKLPPPPPPNSRNTRRWIVELVAAISLIAAGVFSTNLFSHYYYSLGYNNGYIDGKHVGYTQGKKNSVVPTPAQSYSYITGLSSGDPRIFTHAFSETFAHRDITVLSKHKADQFLEICQSSKNPPPGEAWACTNGWDGVVNQINNDYIELNIDPNAPMTATFNSADGDTTAIIMGTFTNTFKSDLPLVHYGTAEFTFGECCGGPSVTYVWSWLILWPTAHP